MIHFARMRSALLLLALLAAAPARAQLDGWRHLSEDDFHSNTYASYNGPPGGLFAPCDKAGRLKLPKPYFKDYKLTKRDLAVFERGMNSVKRFANIKAALEAGYLPVPRSFVPSEGMLLAHPGLIRDGIYNLDRPDILTFVKKKGQPHFRLVGLIYVAGKTRPAPMPDADFDEESRLKDAKGKASAGTWDYEDEVCVVVKPGVSVSIHPRNEIPNGCKEGSFFKRMWRLTTWALVYNPDGLFAERNPMVDYLDRSQAFGSLCGK